ncbi:MAG: hypothetical protein MMC33_002342 [Icmadophila ericetorum]|nr:hypothetical protein [Icmadophila ericetorum]
MAHLDPPSHPLNILVLSGDLLQGKSVLAAIRQIVGTKDPACATFDIICGTGPIGGWLALLLGRFRLSYADASPVWGTLEDLEILPTTTNKDHNKLDEKKFIRNMKTLMQVYDVEDKLAMPGTYHLLHSATNRNHLRCKHVFLTAPKHSSILHPHLSFSKLPVLNLDVLRTYDIPDHHNNDHGKESLIPAFLRAAKSPGEEADGVGLAMQEVQTLYGPDVPIALILNINVVVKETHEVKDGEGTHTQYVTEDTITFDEYPALSKPPAKLVTICLPIAPNPKGESVEVTEALGPWFKKPGIKWEFDNLRKMVSENKGGTKDPDFLMDVASKLALWQERGGQLG